MLVCLFAPFYERRYNKRKLINIIIYDIRNMKLKAC